MVRRHGARARSTRRMENRGEQSRRSSVGGARDGEPMDNRRHDRLSELFERAVELSPDARAHFIEVCSEDPGVRSELRSLLAAHDRTPNLLERIAGDVLPAALQAVADDDARRGPAVRQAQPLGSDAVNAKGAAAAFDPGTRLGSYEIEGRIAAGGIG